MSAVKPMHNSKMPIHKYRAFPGVELTDRQWPAARITRAPYWCSVDLRDGNQALIEPMSPGSKKRLFQTLVEIGFKEIEVGFPAASETDYNFLRLLVEEKLIPDDVTIQVLTQSREPLIRKSFEALQGVRRAIVHLYNSTSELQRRVVFQMDREGVKNIARDGTRIVRDLARDSDSDILFQYSPESFTGTELDYAVEVCEAVMEIWQPTPEKPIILNLPATVEMATPNIHADQIEWFCRHLSGREQARISLHPHNDRGTAVAAAELALMAGADRIEGTLFGNGERTGNVDIVTLALNMITQGIDAGLDLSDIDHIRRVAEDCTGLDVHPRHPYAGDLVYTAFSGSHQDAIAKGMKAMAQSNSGVWEVPYLPIDPRDVGRSYEAIIRVNSQSGKGGVAFLLKSEYGIEMPRRLQIEFSQVVQKVADATGKEITASQIREIFDGEYLRPGPFAYHQHRTVPATHATEMRELTVELTRDGTPLTLTGTGNGPLDALTHALAKQAGVSVEILDYQEHATAHGQDANAVAYVEMMVNGAGPLFGIGLNTNITVASLQAVLSGVNRVLGSEK